MHGAVVLDVHEYCDLLSELEEEEFFNKREPCVTLIANAFMGVERHNEISEQMAEVFSVDPVETEMEAIHLKRKSNSNHNNIHNIDVFVKQVVLIGMSCNLNVNGGDTEVCFV